MQIFTSAQITQPKCIPEHPINTYKQHADVPGKTKTPSPMDDPASLISSARNDVSTPDIEPGIEPSIEFAYAAIFS
jgi:hypothetical protein